MCPRILSVCACCALAVAQLSCFLSMGSPEDEPYAVVSAIFSTTGYSVYSVRPAWSPDGSTIIFSGNLSPSAATTTIWKVRAEKGASPAVLGGDNVYCPSYLSDGRIVYYRGWIGADLNMHIMVADSASAGMINDTVLHTFNGSDVGKGTNRAQGPDEMSVSDDGLRAFFKWSLDSSYVLRWNAFDSLIRSDKVPSQLSSAMISPDGTKIAYTRADGKIVWMPSDIGVEFVVGTGQYPSWDASSTRIGYTNGSVYEVFDVETRNSVFYRVDASVQCPSLSPDASQFAFRTFGGTANGLSIAVLMK